MVAKLRIDATVDGIRYAVNPGEVIPPVLAAYWKAANLEAKIRASGAIAPERGVEPAPRPAQASKGAEKKETD